LDIHSYDVLIFCIGYTKQLLFSLYPCFGSVGMLDSSNPPLAPLLLDLSTGIVSLPVARLPVEPLPKFGTSIVLTGI
jgi:hypothetical protein